MIPELRLEPELRRRRLSRAQTRDTPAVTVPEPAPPATESEAVARARPGPARLPVDPDSDSAATQSRPTPVTARSDAAGGVTERCGRAAGRPGLLVQVASVPGSDSKILSHQCRPGVGRGRRVRAAGDSLRARRRRRGQRRACQ